MYYAVKTSKKQKTLSGNPPLLPVITRLHLVLGRKEAVEGGRKKAGLS